MPPFPAEPRTTNGILPFVVNRFNVFVLMQVHCPEVHERLPADQLPRRIEKYHDGQLKVETDKADGVE